MHCKIIQLNDKSIRKNDRIDMDTILNQCEWFVGSIADYVDDVKDEIRGEVLEFHLKRTGFKFSRNKLTIVSAEDYFKNRYQKLIESASELSRTSLEDVASGKAWMLVWNINDCYDDKFGDYIYYDGYLETMDSFVRNNEGETFYVGGVVDYHY